MSDTLQKIVLPGSTPGSPGVAPSPAYCTTKTTYQPRYVTTVIVDSDGNAHVLQYSAGTIPVTTTTCYPATAGVAPTPGTPADYNLGWNAGAHSVGALAADGAAQFSVLAGSVGALVGLYNDTPNYAYSEIQHGLFFRAGFFSVIESGVERTATATFVTADVFAVVRSGTTVRYFKNAVLLYTSTVPSYGTVTLDAALYAGGDQIISASLVSTIPATLGSTGDGTASFAPLDNSGSDTAIYADGANSLEVLTESGTGPAFAGGVSTFAALSSSGAEATYADGTSVFEVLSSTGTSSGFAPTLALSYNELSTLVGSGLSTTTGASLTPATSLGDNTQNWAPNQWAGYTATIISGTGAGQSLTIADNNEQALLFNTAWPTVPDSTSVYQIALGGTAFATSYVTPGGNALEQLASTGADYAYGAGAAAFMPASSAGYEGRILTGYAFLTAPAPFALTASGTELAPNTFDGTIGFSLRAFGGASAKLAMPSPSFIATGTGAIIGRASMKLPMPILLASGIGGGVGRVDTTLHGGYGLQAFSGAVLSATLQDGYTLKVSGTEGSIGGARLTLPLFALVSSGTVNGVSSAALAMPMIQPAPSGLAFMLSPSARLVAIGTATVAVTTEAYAMQMLVDPTNKFPVQAVSHYTSYPFTQIIRHNDRYYGVAMDGLYQLDGDSDNGAAIPWSFKTGLDDFKNKQLKRMSSMYVNGRVDAGVTVDVIVGEKEEDLYTYTTVRSKDTQNHRVPIGKGLRSRHYGFGISDATGGKSEIDSVDLDIEILKRAI